MLCGTSCDLGICLSTSLHWDHATIYRKLFVPVLLFNTYIYAMAFPSVYLPTFPSHSKVFGATIFFKKS